MTALSENEKTLWVRGLVTFGFAAGLAILTWMANSISTLSESMIGLQRDQGHTATQLQSIQEKMDRSFTQRDATRELDRVEETTDRLDERVRMNDTRLDEYGKRIRDLERDK